jgi:hypothetical protein
MSTFASTPTDALLFTVSARYPERETMMLILPAGTSLTENAPEEFVTPATPEG